MAYTDGLMILGSELAAKQVEDAAADLEDYVMPCNVTILQAGVLVTEDFVAQTTDPIFAVDKKSAIGGTATEVVALTLGSSATLKKGDGVKPAQTAITADTDLDNGHVVLANPQKFPITVKQGEVITLRHDGAATGAGGAYIPFVIVRIDGEVDARPTNVWVDSAAI